MEKIIGNLPPKALAQLAGYLSFDPLVDCASGPSRLLSQLPEPEQLVWLGSHRLAVMSEISLVGGHSAANLFRGGRGVPYTTLVYGLARKLRVDCQPTVAIEDMEAKIVAKVWQNIAAKMTPEERTALERLAEEQAKKLGRSIKGELGSLSALGAAQLSGFGVYMLSSTILGAINAAFGLGLGFGVFAGLSQVIAAVIGPPGWAGVGLVAIVKLGAPNYKKLLPVVVLIASYRELSGAVATQPPTPTTSPSHTVSSDEALDLLALEMSSGDKLFADLSGPEREKVRQAVAERTTQDPSSDPMAMTAAASVQGPAKDEGPPPALSTGIRKRVDDLQKNYLYYFRHLAFLEPALIRLCECDKTTVQGFERKFSVMNEGETKGRHNVPRTDPLVWQQNVGDRRVYFRHDSYQNKIVVLLVGTKSSQNSDYRKLRRRAT